jgi:hypothetical protein
MKGSAVRRFSRVVISAAGALLIAPLVVAAQAVPASAATGKLLVTTLDRNGHAVTANVTVSTDIRYPGGLPTWTTSGKTFNIADGQYAVLAGIEQAVNGVTVGTIAETIVTVSGTGTTRVTLDARKGHLVKVTLDGQPVNDYVDARVCVGATPAQEELFESPGDLYVVPSTSSAFSFAYLAQGQGAAVTAVTPTGIPASPGGAWTSAQLAQVTLNVRSNEQLGSSTSAMLQVGDPPSGMTCGTSLGTQEASNTPPFSESWRVSPGYWSVRTDDYLDSGFDVGGYMSNQRFVAGHSYTDRYYAAAWAPAADMFTFIYRHTIFFTPPSFTDPHDQGSESQTRNHIDLSVNGHFLASELVESVGLGITTPAFMPGISTAGWYTLTDTTTLDPGFALPSTLLSPKATLAWRFYASPSVSQEAPGFWTSFAPAGLSNANSAAPGSQTTVALRPYRDASNPNVPAPSDSVTNLQAWWSGDGTHWNLLTVLHNTHGWYITVPNPANGDVSLRAEVTGSHGDTSTETVYKAYAIS